MPLTEWSSTHATCVGVFVFVYASTQKALTVLSLTKGGLGQKPHGANKVNLACLVTKNEQFTVTFKIIGHIPQSHHNSKTSLINFVSQASKFLRFSLPEKHYGKQS